MSLKSVSAKVSQLHVKLNEMLLNRCVHFEVSQSTRKRGLDKSVVLKNLKVAMPIRSGISISTKKKNTVSKACSSQC